MTRRESSTRPVCQSATRSVCRGRQRNRHGFSVSGPGTRAFSPAQQRFNRLLARIGKLKGQIADVQALADLHRPLFNATLTPLRERFQALMRSMALWLDERLQDKDLRLAQKRTALEILCGLCAALVANGDESMRALHYKRSRHSLGEKDQAAAAGMRAMMEDVFGKPLEVDESLDESLDPVDAVMRAAMAHMQEATQAEQ
ncbi:hypothetical protein [Polaromonas sp.]|uniref:hypothetical protein n=1 Tax=Polaromonas sp. TaxID=1869339 RepID=UPI00185BEC84|nr:hypothetical protein [Polaromonas sp.]NMM06601.1 hypothetical protein [Polaromonas sp.]